MANNYNTQQTDMFKFAKQSQSLRSLLANGFQCYLAYGRHILFWSLFFSVFTLITKLKTVVSGPLWHAPLPAIYGGALPLNKLLYVLFWTVFIPLGYSFALGMTILRMYQEVTDSPYTLDETLRYVLSRLVTLFIATFLIMTIVMVGMRLLILPGMVAAAFLIFTYVFMLCEDTHFLQAIKASVIVVWGSGAKQCMHNLVRVLTLLFFPVLIILLSSIILTWLSHWAMPVFHYLGSNIGPYVYTDPNKPLALGLREFVVEVFVMTMVLPLQIANILVAFNDLKHRVHRPDIHSTVTESHWSNNS